MIYFYARIIPRKQAKLYVKTEWRIYMQTKDFSQRLKTLRSRLRMNQSEFAASIGIKQSTLSSYENDVVTPSADVLITIAEKYNISLDWLCGLSEKEYRLTSLPDLFRVLLEAKELNEIQFEFEINEHLPNDIETEENRYYAGIRFYGNDRNAIYNHSVCQFLSKFNFEYEALETYFSSKETYDIWKEKELNRYKDYPLTYKEYEELDRLTRMRKRDELLKKKFGLE